MKEESAEISPKGRVTLEISRLPKEFLSVIKSENWRLGTSYFTKVAKSSASKQFKYFLTTL